MATTDEPGNEPGKDLKARILVVDDDEDMRQILRFELEARSYAVEEAGDGRTALKLLRDEPFDLAFVDLFLPDLNGYDICSRIKADSDLRPMPVVLITALNDAKAMAKGIDSGADEFIHKPYDKAVLLARVRSLLRASQLRKDLQKSLRECAHLQSVKDQLYRLVIHDLRGPVTSVLGAMDLLEDEIKSGQKDRSLWLLSKANRACENILEMVETLVDIEKMERGELTFALAPLACGKFLRGVLDQWLPLAQTKKIELRLEPPPELTMNADATYIRRALGNLITNAIRYSPPGSELNFGAEDGGATVRFWVQDAGPGLPEEELELIFDPVFQAEHRQRRHEGSYGLGLTLVRLVAEGHGGKAWARSSPGKGARFFLRIPKENKPRPADKD